MRPVTPIDLGDGLMLRRAEAADVDQIVGQNVAAFGPQDGPDVRWYLENEPGLEAWSVVADGDRIASSVGGLPLGLRLDGRELSAYQIEYVVTEADYRRRSLVRHQVDWHHRRAAQRGDLMTTIGGIPYFYRRFGYGYGFDHPELYIFDTEGIRGGEGLVVRDATPSDVDDLVRLEALRPVEGLRSMRDRPHWTSMVDMVAASPWHHLLVAELDGRVEGWARLFDHPDDQRMTLLPSVAATVTVAEALLQASIDRADEHLLVAFDSPGNPFSVCLSEHGHAFSLGHGFYVRIPDPVAFLAHLRPLLSERLAASSFSSDSGEIDLSLYTTGVRLRYDRGEVIEVAACEPVEDPLAEVSVGIPPDSFPALVLGRWGARGLADRVDDVLLGRHAEIIEVLFPPRPADVAGDF